MTQTFRPGRRLLAAGLVALMGWMGAPAAQAVVVIDQPVGTGFGVIYPFSPGQTFTAVTASVESIGVELHNLNPHLTDDRFVTLSLHQGGGTAGPLLAAATVDAAAILGEDTSSAFVAFDLGDVGVVVGETYAFQVTATGERFGISSTGLDLYAGGHGFSVYTILTGDLLFNVTSAVPEPATAALLLAGLAVALGHARRSRGHAQPA